jgi:pyrophosphatase PpaX
MERIVPTMPNSTHPCDAVVFDLDGTLVDTAALHVAATAFATSEVFGQAAPESEIRQSLGRPLPESMRLVSAGRGEIDALERAFMRYYIVHEGDEAQCFASTLAMLDALHAAGFALALLSNKLRAWGQAEIARLGLASYFAIAVFMEDMPQPKPSGWALRPIFDALALPPARVLLVGDGIADIACARASGAQSGAALWGALDRDALIAAGPTFVLPEMSDLLRVVGVTG